ncbi:RNA polymerase sigma factor [Novosphingobium lentum]|uniref:RNA polymerase sigma factor n=1 Tax=Novosphingobium lentum TaxID=145287 RepID=UPI000A83EEFF|nr:RNA polymerase sigma factor [Novosphingobium lentum]
MEMREPDPDRSGLARLFELHRGEVRRFLVARCGSPEDADDLLQDMWVRIAATTVGPIGNGRAYLFRIANNLVLDAARARQRAMRRDRGWVEADGEFDDAIDERPDRATPADEALARKQEAALLEHVIAGLPAGAQRALRLHRIEELSQSDVAQVMGISRSGVEKHLAVAMKHLRRALHDCGWYAPVASGDEETGTAGGSTGKAQPMNRKPA